MKENDAQEKVCPFRGMSGVNTRTDEDYYSDGNCIASDCMMWIQDTSYWAKDGRRISTESDEFNNYLTPEDGGLETVCEGHCGLTK